MSKNNSVYVQDIQDILSHLGSDYSLTWGKDDFKKNFPNGFVIEDFLRLYAFRGHLSKQQLLWSYDEPDLEPQVLGIRLECTERVCYVLDEGQIVPEEERIPQPYHKKLRGPASKHLLLPTLYAGDEVIVFYGVPNRGDGEDALWVINLTDEEYEIFSNV